MITTIPLLLMKNDNLYVEIGQHALERFLEHHRSVAKEIGFISKWENERRDKNKQFNTFLLYELLKRSEKQKAIHNDPAYLISVCERNNMEINELSVYSNGGVIFICHEQGNKLTVRTVMPMDYKMGQYVAKKKTNFDDKNHHFRLSTLSDKEYKEQVNKMVSLSSENPLICERLEKISNSYTQEQRESFNKNDSIFTIGKRIKSLPENVFEKLDEHGITYVHTIDKGLSICYLNSQFSDPEKQHTLAVIPKSVLLQLVNNEKSFKLLNQEEKNTFLKVNSLHLSKKNYFTLLGQVFNNKTNETFLSTVELKEILKHTIPEHIKRELGISNKDISNPEKMEKLLANKSTIVRGYLSLASHHFQDLQIMTTFHQEDNDYSYHLTKDHLTHELYFVKTQDGNSETVIPSMEEYLHMIQLFVEKFDNHQIKLPNDFNKSDVFHFLDKELDKFKYFSNTIQKLTQNYDNMVNPSIVKKHETTGLMVLKRGL